VHHYQATSQADLQLAIELEVGTANTAGATVTIVTSGGQTLNYKATTRLQIDETIALNTGERLSITVEGGANGRAESVKYRFRLRDPAKCGSTI